MLRVTLRGHGVLTAVLGSGETLLFGRSPAGALPEVDAAAQLRFTALDLPRCAPHVSRLLGELSVGEEMVRLLWRGGVEAQLSSLFDAPGGTRRVGRVQHLREIDGTALQPADMLAECGPQISGLSALRARST